MAKPNPYWSPQYLTPLAFGELNLFSKIMNDSLIQIDSTDSHFFVTYSDSTKIASVQEYLAPRSFGYKGSYQSLSFSAFPDSVNFRTPFAIFAQAGGIFNPEDGKDYIIPAMGPSELPAETLSFNNIKYLHMTDGKIVWKLTNNNPIDFTNLSYRLVNDSTGDIFARDTIPLLVKNSQEITETSLVGEIIPGTFRAVVSYTTPGSDGEEVLYSSSDSLISEFVLKDLEADWGNAIIPSSQIASDTSIQISDTVYDSRLTFFTLESGKLKLSLKNYFTFPVEPVLSFPSIKRTDNDSILRVPLTLTAYPGTGQPTPVESESDLTGYYLDFRGPNQNSYNLFGSQADLNLSSQNQYVDFSISDSIYFELNLSELVPVSLRGFVGQQAFSYKGKIPFKNSMFDKIQTGTIGFEKVELTVEFENHAGFDMQPSINKLYSVNSRDTNKVVELNPLPNMDLAKSATDVPFENLPYTPTLYSYTIPNMADVFANFPKTIVIDMSAQINPDPAAKDRLDNFVYRSSDLIGKFQVNFPLSISLTNVTLTDTVNFSVGKLTGSGEDTAGVSAPEFSEYGIEDGSLHVILYNQFPLEVSMKIFLVDSSFTVVDSIHKSPIRVGPGLPDPVTKKVKSPGTRSATVFKIEGKLATALNKTKKIIAKAELNTPFTGNTNTALFFADYRIRFHLAGDLKLKVSGLVK